jgi:hypothetical protein
MFTRLVNWVKQTITTAVQGLRKQISGRTKPLSTSLAFGSLCDLVRSKPELVAENAVLRQQVIVLNRSVKRPHLTSMARSILVLLARRIRVSSPSLFSAAFIKSIDEGRLEVVL